MILTLSQNIVCEILIKTFYKLFTFLPPNFLPLKLLGSTETFILTSEWKIFNLYKIVIIVGN